MSGEIQDGINPPNNVILNIAESEMLRLGTICRLCANQNERIIGIYSEEGLSHNLAGKMNMYLPVKVTEHDTLPLQCCWSCASTVLAWHELVIGSVEADRRLQELQIIASKQLIGLVDVEDTKIQVQTKPEFEEESTAASLSVFYETASTTNDDDDDDNQVDEVNSSKYEDKLDIRILKPEEISRSFEKKSEDIVINEPNIPEEKSTHEVEDLKTESVMAKRVTRRRAAKKTNQSIVVQELPIKKDNNTNGEWREKDDKLEVYQFACQYCSFVFINEDDIVQHVKDQHPDELDMLPTEPLLETLDKKEKKKHSKLDQDAINTAKIVVDGRIYYNCKICGKSLHSPYTYMWHMRIHTGERPYVCDLCGKQFRVSQGLVRHLRETHEGIKNFPCDLCGRMFATRRNVEEHRRIHTNERPYVCDLCGKAFKQKASLFVHNRSHTDHFPYRCGYCSQGFRTRPPLLIHVTRHTGEKPYPCDICGRCFRIKYELKRHRLVHSDEKPFTCTECGLSFRQKRYLRNHNKTNHNRTTP